jgi:hypothetical protein
MVRGKHMKRWKREVVEKGGWVHGKARIKDDRYHWDRDENRSPME